MQPFDGRIALTDQQYVIAFQSDNRPRAADEAFTSYAEAADHLQRAARLDPALPDNVHIIPSSEVNKAA